jgi:predicted Zn-dependent protease
MKKFIVAILIISAVYACSKVPVTGRKQINLVSDSEMNSMSLTSYNEFLTENKGKVLSSGPEVVMVKRVGANIAKAVTEYMTANKMQDAIKNFQWEFNVVDDKTVNAWCMPGGKVVVYTGIMSVAKNETALAVVMGHEIAHAVAKHGSERMSQGLLQEFGGAVLSQALSQKSEVTKGLFMTAYGAGSNILGVLPFSRLQESEADKLGLIFMAMAGYNPEEAISFWQRMSAASQGGTPEFLSTHPSDDTRIKQIKDFLPEALKYYKPN